MERKASLNNEAQIFKITVLALTLLSIIINLYNFLQIISNYSGGYAPSTYSLISSLLLLASQIFFALYIFSENKSRLGKQLPLCFLVSALSGFFRLLSPLYFIISSGVMSYNPAYWTLVILFMLLTIIGYALLALFYKTSSLSNNKKNILISAAIIVAVPIIRPLIFSTAFSSSASFSGLLATLCFPVAVLLYILKLSADFDRTSLNTASDTSLGNRNEYLNLEAQLLSLRAMHNKGEITEEEFSRRKREILDKLS